MDSYLLFIMWHVLKISYKPEDHVACIKISYKPEDIIATKLLNCNQPKIP